MNRNVGLDIARIMAMCGVIILHILGKGGELVACNSNSVKYWISWLIEICAYCSVDLFAILSGWLGIFKKNYSVFRALELIMIMLFYTLIITVIFFVINPQIFDGVGDLLYSIFPVLAGRYWYITCYIPIVIFQPFINRMLLALSNKRHKTMCIVAIVMFSVIPSILKIDFFAFKDGYSFIWLLLCYTIGAYLKRVEFESLAHNSIRCLCGFWFGTVILLFGNVLLYAICGFDWHYLISYISPFILIMAISLLIFMKNLKFKKEKPILKKLSMAAFDVYIIHCHILIFDFVIKDSFIWLANLEAFFIIVLVIICSIGIYMGLSLIGMIRIFLFEAIKLNKINRIISAKINNSIYKE